MTNELVRRLGAEKHVLLTTFRKNGEAISTPVWVAEMDGELVTWHDPDTGKVKRIRNDDRVEVQGCDLRGRATHGPKATGRARILDDDARDRAHLAIARKYGLRGRLVRRLGKLRGRRNRTVSLAITLDPPAAD